MQITIDDCRIQEMQLRLESSRSLCPSNMLTKENKNYMASGTGYEGFPIKFNYGNNLSLKYCHTCQINWLNDDHIHLYLLHSVAQLISLNITHQSSLSSNNAMPIRAGKNLFLEKVFRFLDFSVHIRLESTCDEQHFTKFRYRKLII